MYMSFRHSIVNSVITYYIIITSNSKELLRDYSVVLLSTKSISAKHCPSPPITMLLVTLCMARNICVICIIYGFINRLFIAVCL